MSGTPLHAVEGLLASNALSCTAATHVCRKPLWAAMVRLRRCVTASSCRSNLAAGEGEASLLEGIGGPKRQVTHMRRIGAGQRTYCHQPCDCM